MVRFAVSPELVLCWVAWSLAFVAARKRAWRQKKVVRASASLWGILLEMAGYVMVWAFLRPVGVEQVTPRLIASTALGLPSAALAWVATRHLVGKQWRYEAALSEEHELIQTGPYRWVRHPIYASMLGMLLATGAAGTWWPMLVAAILVFLAGTEIRVRAEEGLLAERFQDSYRSYRSRVRAYVPFLR